MIWIESAAVIPNWSWLPLMSFARPTAVSHSTRTKECRISAVLRKPTSRIWLIDWTLPASCATVCPTVPMS